MDQDGRRNFLMASLGCVIAVAAGVVSYPVFRYLAPRQNNTREATVSFAETDVPPGGAKFFDFKGSPGVIIRKNGGELAAFSAVCTHLGCIVQWENESQDFLCPCHSGRYTADGGVISGPPPKSLAALPFTVTNGTIIIGWVKA